MTQLEWSIELNWYLVPTMITSKPKKRYNPDFPSSIINKLVTHKGMDVRRTCANIDGMVIQWLAGAILDVI